MKHFFSALFLFICINGSLCLSEAREFIISYLSTVEKRPIILHKECFGPKFDTQFIQLMEYVATEKYTKMVFLMKEMAFDIYLHCPSKDFIAIYSIFKVKFEDGSIYDNLNDNLARASEILVKEFKSGKSTPTSVGKSLGQVTLIFIKQYSSPIPTKESKISSSLNSFIEGVLTGLQVEQSEGKCLDDYESNKLIISSAITDFIHDIKKGKCIIEAYTKLIEKLKSLVDFEDDCRINELYIILQNMFTQEGFKEIIQRIIMQREIIAMQIKILIEKIKEKDHFGIGHAQGNIIHLILDYYVN